MIIPCPNNPNISYDDSVTYIVSPCIQSQVDVPPTSPSGQYPIQQNSTQYPYVNFSYNYAPIIIGITIVGLFVLLSK